MLAGSLTRPGGTGLVDASRVRLRVVARIMAFSGWTVAACSDPTGSSGPGDGPPPVLWISASVVEPTVASAGEPFRFEITVPAAIGPVVHFHPDRPLGLRRNGVVLDSLLLRDDGTDGDEVAGDHRYSLDGLVLPVDGRGLATSNVGFAWDLHEPGQPHQGQIVRVKASFRSVDTTRVRLPP
jgi:hypothetical protein